MSGSRSLWAACSNSESNRATRARSSASSATSSSSRSRRSALMHHQALSQRPLCHQRASALGPDEIHLGDGDALPHEAHRLQKKSSSANPSTQRSTSLSGVAFPRAKRWRAPHQPARGTPCLQVGIAARHGTSVACPVRSNAQTPRPVLLPPTAPRPPLNPLSTRCDVPLRDQLHENLRRFEVVELRAVEQVANGGALRVDDGL